MYPTQRIWCQQFPYIIYDGQINSGVICLRFEQKSCITSCRIRQWSQRLTLTVFWILTNFYSILYKLRTKSSESSLHVTTQVSASLALFYSCTLFEFNVDDNVHVRWKEITSVPNSNWSESKKTPNTFNVWCSVITWNKTKPISQKPCYNHHIPKRVLKPGMS